MEVYIYLYNKQKESSLGHERVVFFGIFCLSQRKNWEYDTEGFLRMSVCVCVCACVRTCGQRVAITPGEPS